jgi:hypothetical protein
MVSGSGNVTTPLPAGALVTTSPFSESESDPGNDVKPSAAKVAYTEILVGVLSTSGAIDVTALVTVMVPLDEVMPATQASPLYRTLYV